MFEAHQVHEVDRALMLIAARWREMGFDFVVHESIPHFERCSANARAQGLN